jgi:hypothetical protein
MIVQTAGKIEVQYIVSSTNMDKVVGDITFVVM